jgi:hypothetical protein
VAVAVVVVVGVVVGAGRRLLVPLGFGAKPACDIGRLGVDIERAEAEDFVRRQAAVRRLEDRRAGIERAEPAAQRRGLVRRCEVGLGQRDAVGDRGLLDRLHVGVELARAQ